jgi:aminoglycoside phosphotransferase family enzyme/predicted kinase
MTATGWFTQRETHIAVVMLIGDRAYKLKKPVDMGFLDFSTRAKRLAACRREVDLNRRLAPDVYLGVADVLGPDGNPCDHLVVMRRMPDERRLSALVRAGEPLDEVIHQLARLIAAFHASGHPNAAIAADGSRDAIQARWQASFDQIRPTARDLLGAATVAEIEQLTMEFLAGRKTLFDQRIADGRIVDGHGDLLADDIFCLNDGPRVLDCLEFDDHLRWLDGLDDIAFLAMDLERLSAPQVARQLLHDYLEFAGDLAPKSLLHHYIAYRAFVRVKVACLRHSQGDEASAGQAREYAEIAARHLRSGRVRMILVGGLPGTGKSTLATGLANALGAVLLSADRVRKEIAGLSLMDNASAGYREGIYTPEHAKRTYGELLYRAETLLALGESVVIDASWTRGAHRVLAAQVAGATHSHLVELQCAAPAKVAAERLRTRTPSGSDADPQIAAQMAQDADEWPDASIMDTTRSVGTVLADALEGV